MADKEKEGDPGVVIIAVVILALIASAISVTVAGRALTLWGVLLGAFVYFWIGFIPAVVIQGDLQKRLIAALVAVLIVLVLFLVTILGGGE